MCRPLEREKAPMVVLVRRKERDRSGDGGGVIGGGREKSGQLLRCFWTRVEDLF